MAYLFVPFPVTSDDLKGHSPNAGLIKCNSTNICATLARFYLSLSRYDSSFYRTMLCIRGTSHGPVPVRVRPSHVGVLSKRLNESSWFSACLLPSTRPTLC